MSTSTVTVPKLGGARQSAAALVANLPEHCTALRIDLGQTTSAAQGYIDELVYQTAQMRELDVVFVGASERAAQYAMESAGLRGVSEFVSVLTRE